MDFLGEVEFSCVVLPAERQYHRHSDGHYEYHCEETLAFYRPIRLESLNLPLTNLNSLVTY